LIRKSKVFVHKNKAHLLITALWKSVCLVQGVDTVNAKDTSGISGMSGTSNMSGAQGKYGLSQKLLEDELKSPQVNGTVGFLGVSLENSIGLENSGTYIKSFRLGISQNILGIWKGSLQGQWGIWNLSPEKVLYPSWIASRVEAGWWKGNFKPYVIGGFGYLFFLKTQYNQTTQKGELIFLGGVGVKWAFASMWGVGLGVDIGSGLSTRRFVFLSPVLSLYGGDSSDL
jgi:hypothetical protein